MRKGIVALLLVFVPVSGYSVARGQSPAYLQAKNALVLVETSGGIGSGFAVASNLVATACHVIQGVASIRLHFWAAKAEVAGQQRSCDEQKDVAFISTTVPEGTTILEFAAEKPAQGEQIWVWGYPLGTAIALEPSVAAGIVSATNTAQGFLALDVSGAPGNSGGPVVNAQGKVVGIFVASWLAGREGSTGFKYAAPGTVAASLMKAGFAPGGAANAVRPSGGITIRPGEGIGSLKLGMTPGEAQQAIGLPPSDRDGPWYTWGTRQLTARFENGKIGLLFTEDPAEVTAEGIRVGSTDTDLIKAYGTPVCSAVLDFRGRAGLAWVYEGLIVFLNGSPRRVFVIVVTPNESAKDFCN